jgi:diaminopimelate epimerase
MFPKRTNVEFVQVINRREIRVRAWERGAGETLACGTGACASAVASHTLGKTDKEVTVHLSGGDLKILYDCSVFMTGPAVKVFLGELYS